ncbi:helix-turn-helix domain-containing protein [Saccharopolyspora sp. HNM0986]|uniref:helix-turn-helix domain-containing protein n=1 Tax=Saccharopolyspora galaxeae TaxID=2781241 RepID=UPI00190D5F49|nr:helix-turn-helix transcriptional regulator [Saccharopolyspora sp. HNM0986]MBK0865406.1 helix-turn-helix domain-containing protein [Saccharopolyspora sp. HNM0986]
MLDEDPGPVVQRLILGERLRALREASGVGLDDANAALGWYRGKLSKVETGTLGASEKELTTLLSRYGVTGPDAEQVRQLGREARRRAAPERVSDWAKQYIPLERASSEIRMVYGEVPGLLQTKDYARAQLSRSPVVTAADLDSMAAAREERGNRLYRDGAPHVWAVLGEEALRRRVGTHDQMGTQLRRLREIADLPSVTLKVVPLEHGPHAGLSCPFTLLWIEQARATIAYVETLTGADYVKSTEAYTLAFDQAEGDALSEDDTRALIDRCIQGVTHD